MNSLHCIPIAELGLSGEMVEGVFELVVFVGPLLPGPYSPENHRTIGKRSHLIWLYDDPPGGEIDRDGLGVMQATADAGSKQCRDDLRGKGAVLFDESAFGRTVL